MLEIFSLSKDKRGGRRHLDNCVCFQHSGRLAWGIGARGEKKEHNCPPSCVCVYIAQDFSVSDGESESRTKWGGRHINDELFHA